MKTAVEAVNQQYSTSIRIRTGISIGPVVAGVIGQKKFAYDLWGATVNLVFQLKSAAQPGTILVGQELYERLKTKFRFESAGIPNPNGGGDFVAHRLMSGF